MKRVLICVLSAVMVVTVAGCSSKKPETTKQEGNIVAEEVNSEMIKYFGKVKSIVGNEIELELAKEMEVQLADGSEFSEGSGIISMDELPEGSPVEGGEVTSSIEASEASSGETFELKEGEEVPEGVMIQATVSIGNGEKMKLEYTGETKTLIIPAGASILNFVSGKDGKVSDIKEGSVVMIYANGKDKSEVVSTVEIRE